MQWWCNFNHFLPLSQSCYTENGQLQSYPTLGERVHFIFCKTPKMWVLCTCINRGNDLTTSPFPVPLYPFFPLFSIFIINNKWTKKGINCTSGSALARALRIKVATAAKRLNFKMEILLLKLSVRDWLIIAAKWNRPVP